MRNRASYVIAAAVASLALSAPAAADPLPQQPAAEIDPAPFTHAVPFTVPPSPDGVAKLRLGPEVLAAARADLADVRVVDGASRQWPYILRTEADREEVALGVELARGERGHSRYRLALPVAPAAVDAVTLVIDRPFFDRAYRLLGDLSGSTPASRSVPLASGRLARAAGGPATVDIAFARHRVSALTLLVDDGDEAPLPITAARATVPLAEIRVVAPPGAYTLLVGDAEAEPPRYEIARLRDRVVAAPAPACAPSALAPNPRHRARGERGSGLEQAALWMVMGLAVLVLAGLTLRLSRREQQGGGAPPGR